MRTKIAKSRNFLYLLCGLSLVLFSSCIKPFSEKGENFNQEIPLVTGITVAQIDEYSISLQDLDEDIERYNSLVPQDRPQLKITTHEQKLNYLKNELVKQILLYKEALNRNLDKDFEIQRALKRNRMQLLVFQLINEEINKINITSSEIEDYYNNLSPEYKRTPEEREVSEIVVKTQERAKGLLIKLLQGESFSALAGQYSLASSAKNAGSLGFISPGLKFREFDEIAFSDILKQGQISSIFKGPEGYYIIKLEVIRGGKPRSLTDMWDEIKALLNYISQQKVMEELIGRLSRDAAIVIKSENIE